MSRKAKEFNFSYDKKNDDLFLYNPKSKSKGSIEIGDLIFDFNNKKELVGLQMMNASQMIKDLISDDKKDTADEVVNNLKRCMIDIKYKNNLLIIRVYLTSKKNEISPIISMPMHKELSPALAYA